MVTKNFNSAKNLLNSEIEPIMPPMDFIEVPINKIVKFPKSRTVNTRKFDFSGHYTSEIEQIVAACQKAIEFLVEKSIRSGGTTLSINSIKGYCSGGLIYFFPYCRVLALSLGRNLLLSDLNLNTMRQYIRYLDGLELSPVSKKNAYARAKAVITEVGRMKYLDGDFHSIFPKNPYPSINKTIDGAKAYSEIERKRITLALQKDLTPLFKKNSPLNGYECAVCFFAIALRTGLNSTPLLELSIDCIQEHPLKNNRKLLLSFKRRGKSTHALSIRKTEEIASIDTIMPEVVSIIELLINLNKDARDALNSRDLFAFIPSGNNNPPTHLTYGSTKRLAADFVEKHKLISHTGEPLKLGVGRLRKTFISRIWNLSNQDPIVTAAMAGHTLQVSNDYYLEPPPEAEKNFQLLGEIRVEELLSDKFSQLENTPTGKCHDPLSGHLAPKNGSYCTSFLSCFRCKSFVVTQDDLYRLFSLYFLLIRQRRDFTKKKWGRLYSHIIRIIDREIAPKFDAKLISEVRESAEKNPHPYWTNTELLMTEEFSN